MKFTKKANGTFSRFLFESRYYLLNDQSHFLLRVNYATSNPKHILIFALDVCV